MSGSTSSTHDGDEARQRALERLRILDTLPEQVYDDLVLLASEICGTPIALVSLIDHERQWFKARLGLDVAETHRDLAFCWHAVVEPASVLVVPDALQDPRFAGNALVTGAPNIRFYAGAPIVLHSGEALGTVCVIDTEPRKVSPSQLRALQALARQAAALLELRERTMAAEQNSSDRARAQRALQQATDLLGEMGAMAHVGGWELDLRTHTIQWTDEVYRIHDLEPGSPIALASNIDFYAAEAQPVIRAAVQAAIDHGEPWDLELPFVTARGRQLWVRAQGKAVQEGGTTTRLIGAFQDITDRRRVADALAGSERRLRMIADNLPAMISYVDREQRYRFVNAHVGKIFGSDPEAMLGRTMRDCRGDELHAELAPHFQAALAGETVTFQSSASVGGRLFHYQSDYIPDRDPAGSVQGFYALTFDITALKETQRQLDRLARVDGLTGLANRRQFEESLHQAMARTRRSELPMAVMFLDVDRFKDINDAYGHAVGDTVLRGFAERMNTATSKTDLVARLAGDEFVIVLEGIDRQRLADLAQTILSALRAPFDVDGRPLAVTVSIGVARYEGGALDASALLKSADAALYASKDQGRDRCTFA